MMVGMLAGAVLSGKVSNTFGRKKCIFLFNCIMIQQASSSAPVEFDDVFQIINSFGPYQKAVYFSSSILMFLTYFPYFMLVFVFATPPFQCITPNVTCPPNTCCDNCTSYSFDGSFTSTVTEWNLICGRASLNAAIQTCIYVGMLVGAFVTGVISDAYGRKKSIFLFNGVLIVGGLASSFSNSVPMMAVFWLVMGFGIIGLYLPIYTFLMETVGPDSRTMAGVIPDVCFGLAGIMFAMLAYFVRDWKILIMVTTAPGVLLYLFWRHFPESPRWLVAHNRLEEALLLLLKYGGRKNEPIDKDRLKSIISEVRRNQIERQKKSKRITDPRMICRTPKIRKWTAAMAYIWFSISFLCNGLFLFIDNVSGNLYLNVTIIFVIGILQLPITWFVLKMFGRRIPNAVILFLIGMLCLLILAVPNKLPMVKSGLFVAANTMNGSLWSALSIRTSELYPTVIRDTGLGILAMISRVGGIVAPFVSILGRVPGIGVTVPVVIFGVISLTAGVTSLFIPETLFAPMHQTVEEAEAAPEDYGIPCWGRPGNKRENVDVERYESPAVPFETKI